MSLYKKHRPQQLSQIIGNEETISALQNIIEDPDRPHSYLLSGPTGCGKTTIARILASEIGIQGGDFVELDTADFRGIDTVRKIRETAILHPLEGDARLFLLDECHKMTNDAQNALLKILEDTPDHVYFVLCTTDPDKLLKTVRGRCSIFELRPLNDKQMLTLLRRVVKEEEESLTKQVYEQIIEDTQGLPRNALQVLDTVLRTEEDQRMEAAKKGAQTQNESIELCRLLIDGAGWKRVSAVVKGLRNEDPESVRRHVLGYASSVALNGKDPARMGLILESFSEPYYNTNFSGLVLSCLSVFHS